ncbi:hypothetical protein ACIQZD_13645 [Peribacillus sp. NPDC096447]|uniref:hypothetical protein n=1 Tax=Peribacillus sp. NPDC096447 TaxID=3364394 RepID=UPI0038277443
MDMINIFNAPTKAFNEMLYVNGQEVFHNGSKRYAIITNPDIKEFNDKYISTDYKTKRGDYIYYNEMYWMIMNQVTVPRAESFKGIMRQVEHDIIFNLMYAGESSKYLLKLPAIVSRTSDYTQNYDQMMITVDSEIHVFVQDTSRTRKIFNLVGKSDGQIVLGNRNYDIIGASIEKKGYIDITCRMGFGNGVSDYINGIYWKTGETVPANWQSQYDQSFYQREGVVNLPAVPNGYQTSVTITTSKTDVTDVNGTITATWTDEANKATYNDFKGYTVRLLLSNGYEIAMATLTDVLTHTFSDLAVGSYIVEVYARFGENSTIIPETATTDIADGNAPVPTPATDTTDVRATAYNDSNSYGTLTWTEEKDKNAYTGFYGYRVEVWTSSMFGGDSIQEYWETTTEEQDIRTGWSGEMGWFVTIQSIFHKETGEQLMQPYRISGDDLTALPDEYYPSPW